MNQPFYYGCGGGCKNCPRRRECAMAGSAAAVPVLAEQPLTPMAGSGAAAPMPAIPKDNPPAAAPTEIPWEPVPANLPVVRLPAVLTSDTMDAYPELTAFLQENHQRGVLRLQAFRGQQSIPMEGVRVSVSRPMDERLFLFFEGRTDASGIIDSIVLPAPPRGQSLSPGQPDPSATYRLHAELPQYLPLDTTVDIYEGVKTVQPIQLRLRME